jgi:hypothetical protein
MLSPCCMCVCVHVYLGIAKSTFEWLDLVYISWHFSLPRLRAPHITLCVYMCNSLSLLGNGCDKLPDQWKEFIIVPVHKKGDKNDCSNYRGISLLSTS